MITNDTRKQGTYYATTETSSKAIKMSAGEEILILTKEIAKESADIAERFFVKFEKIMESRSPAKELNADTNFPPYFQELAIGLREIRKNIDRIQEGIQRAEI